MAHCGHIMCGECATGALRHSSQIVGSLGLQPNVTGHRLKIKCAPCPICRHPFTSAALSAIQASLTPESDTWFDVLNRLQIDSEAPNSESHGSFYYSSKLKCLEAIILKIISSGYRCVVFSQWVKLLDIVERLLALRKIKYNRLDGSQSSALRKRELDAFTSDLEPLERLPPLSPKNFFPSVLCEDTVSVDWSDELWKEEVSKWDSGEQQAHARGRVLLASLKAGGVGLNLIAANYLVLLDAWWNPAVEEQAMQRVHRIGQSLPVTIFRLYVRGSVEEGILELHKKKHRRAKEALEASKSVPEGSSFTSKISWSLEEMKSLFQV
eukprot:Gregarina_sp_Poly_1__1214@NODE_1299_length_4435_cov_13_644231_g879_i0_p1_GENE_NODE_1299_length_4435_cov_13_644231_g879_i0NODE_1299_length_4435_cov_13_644231_g879_i0_p1_ORF_typecomplete_len324_score50_89Helicase_C/PF00271_31/9_9e13HDA23/PF11496_8/1_2e11zfC3HC4_3/PF13920_6/6e05ProkRING_4/PF14447_6/0_0023zfRING_5/PF14634_6/0_025zfC3HC4_2/PF13923_6/0_074zfC3HC4_2/PF13923_6/1e02zfRING_2/PF13639_6/0_037zfRING_UBOX/PF13445_6/0_52zfRING_UBOX/PF13445_6/7_5zfRING_UBOX/PF13445_6/1_8e04zfC3HC4/PF00097_25/2_